MKKENTHVMRESWLHSAVNELRPYFEKFGYTLPDKMRGSISFTSGGKKGVSGEIWHPAASADQHYEIIIKIDRDDPLEILTILFRQLVRSLLPSSVKFGKEFREIALRLGLEGKMREATPTPLLREHLIRVAATLGPLPHGRLDYNLRPEALKKPGIRMLKAECAVCAYSIHVLPKFAKQGLPNCPVDKAHGAFQCDLPEEDIAVDKKASKTKASSSVAET